jgi:hypothetical protein
MAGRKEDDVDAHIRAVWHETRGEQFGRHGNAGETLMVDGIDMGFGLRAPFDFGKDGQPFPRAIRSTSPAGSSPGGR